MKLFFTTLFILFTGFLFSQELSWIEFTDKPSKDYYLAHPEEMLSEKALQRREKYQIPLSVDDVPVEADWVEELKTINTIEIIGSSKWFNGVFAWINESDKAAIQDLDFVKEIHSFMQANRNKTARNAVNRFKEPVKPVAYSTNKTAAYTDTQINQLKLQTLHEAGFTGKDIDIAILDNGFTTVNTAEGFKRLRDNQQIKETYNFVTSSDNVYSSGDHGTMVLSTIGGYLEDQFMGTAIDANFYLFVTENDMHEMPDEEVNWILGAEKADSLGVDVINSSLGYYDFDDSRYDYVYEDMDGQTTYISRGAQIAADKGIMVVNAAGNEGFSSWHYIGAPADAEGVFSIGAVDQYGQPAWFTSYGPTADGRIKPDVSALGSDAAVIYGSQVMYADGTSFASPIMAGAMACLIQFRPNILPAELREIVRASANHYDNPTDQLGYGIPDFDKIYNESLAVSPVSEEAYLKLYPNPTSDRLYIETKEPVLSIEILSVDGKLLKQWGGEQVIDLSYFDSDLYFIKTQFENGKTLVRKIMKN